MGPLKVGDPKRKEPDDYARHDCTASKSRVDTRSTSEEFVIGWVQFNPLKQDMGISLPVLLRLSGVSAIPSVSTRPTSSHQTSRVGAWLNLLISAALSRVTVTNDGGPSCVSSLSRPSFSWRLESLRRLSALDELAEFFLVKNPMEMDPRLEVGSMIDCESVFLTSSCMARRTEAEYWRMTGTHHRGRSFGASSTADRPAPHSLGRSHLLLENSV